MHNNYFFLKQLSKQLRQELVGFQLGALFSQSKNELIIELYIGEKERYIKAHLTPQFCCLSFPNTFNRARKNSVDLFQSICGHKILDVIQIENDRSFYLELEDQKQLLFKMHGTRSNIILMDKDSVVMEMFNNKLRQDQNLQIHDLSKKVILDKKAFQIHKGNYNRLIPTLGKGFEKYLEDKSFDQATPDIQLAILQELLVYLEKPQFYLRYSSKDIPQLRLYKGNPNDIAYTNPTEILNVFFREFVTRTNLENEKRNRNNYLNQRIRKSQSYVTKTSKKLDQLIHSTNYKHFGDLLMANLHQIESFTSEVKLLDFYTQKTIKIPLKSNLTPQLNAEKYYRKAKRQKIEIDMLAKTLAIKKAEIEELKIQLSNLDEVKNLKELIKKPILGEAKTDSPFHKITFMDFEILIGKNANKNEILTFKTAKKDDLFLHAKDSPGSHVIIRKKGGQNFPEQVIEKAASFAAFYSKNKSESLCRVLYTPKKYIRKANGRPRGAVIVEREKVMLVQPEKPTGIKGH